MKVLDLFSGIGGFSLGLERAGMETVAFCEINPFCQQILKKHWPHVPIHGDITELRGKDVGPVDLICGGFPCQDISIAGQQKGIDGEKSGLWTEMARLISDIRPQYAIVENVSELLRGPNEKKGGWFGRVLRDLAEIGYDAEWHCIPASVFGAPHVRPRVWIVAHPNGERQFRWPSAFYRHESWKGGKEQLEGLHEHCLQLAIPASTHGRIHDGVPRRVDRLRALGNAVVPQIPEMIGRAIMQAELD